MGVKNRAPIEAPFESVENLYKTVHEKVYRPKLVQTELKEKAICNISFPSVLITFYTEAFCNIKLY
jgi:hypothetical protein